MYGKRFEDLFIWQEARALVNDIYNYLKDCKDYGFKDQFQRAGISIMNNIAEGYDRNSSKELVLFFKYAKGSCGEVQSMTYLAEDLNYLTSEKAHLLRSRCKKISSGIISFKRYLLEKTRSKIVQGFIV